MKIRDILIILLLCFFLTSCQSAKDAFQTKKRSNTNQEFLVEKKQPLTAPPDINELPIPTSEEFEYEENSEDISVVKKILYINEDKSNALNSSNQISSLEDSILEKIYN